MHIFIFVILMNCFRALRSHLREVRESKPEPLCVNCFYAHLQYGSKAQRAISCTYGGGVRAVNFDVLYCTDYQGRNPVSRLCAIGFAREIDEKIAA